MQKLNDFALRAFVKAANGFQKFQADNKGVTAIEYGLIAGIIAVGIVATLGTLKTSLTTLFTSISTSLSAA